MKKLEQREKRMWVCRGTTPQGKRNQELKEGISTCRSRGWGEDIFLLVTSSSQTVLPCFAAPPLGIHGVLSA